MSANHCQEKLLEFAYGELSPAEANAVEVHLNSCAQCSGALQSIRQVRNAMSQLPLAEPSSAGLQSLLSYAQQAAQRAQARSSGSPGWRRWLVPTAGVAAAALVGVVSMEVLKVVDLSPRSTPINSSPTAGEASEAARAPASMPAKGESAAPPGPAAEAEPLAIREQERKTLAAPKQGQEREGRAQAKKVQEPLARAQREEPVSSPKAASGVAGSILNSESPARETATAPIEGGVAQAAPQAGARGERAKETANLDAFAGAKSAGDGARLRQPHGEQTDTAQPLGVPSAAPPANRRSFAREVAIDAGAKRWDGEAKKAKLAGNRAREVELLRQALAAGAQGPQRADLLGRLSDALDSVGNKVEAETIREQLIREFPTSERAKAAWKRRSNPPATALPAAPPDAEPKKQDK